MTGLDVQALWDKTAADVTAALRPVEWAEDEIEQAQKRHPDAGDLLYHAFPLLRPPRAGHPLPEFVVRGHARELLDRLASGEDTRPGTYAEICLVCSEASLHVPLGTTGTGLYFRAWLRAFPDVPIFDGQADQQRHYEALKDTQIDQMERELRRKLTQPSRRLRDVDCQGTHHGEPVACRFATLLPVERQDAPRSRAPAQPGRRGQPRHSPGEAGPVVQDHLF